MTPVSTAIVGCGYWGVNDIRVLQEIPVVTLPVVTLPGVCDTSAGRLEHLQERFHLTRAWADLADSTDTKVLRPQGGLRRERIFDLYQEGFEWFAGASGFDPRKRGARAKAYEYGQSAVEPTF